MLLLDTQVWIWWLLRDEALTEEELQTLDEHARKGEIAVSAASVWEAELLEGSGKLFLKENFESWIVKATDPKVCKVIPIDTQVISAQRKLPITFPDDPADRLIVTTALMNNYSLATKNEKIQNIEF
ncbi:MAG TPA: PIN domain nuclease [Balneolaceae bacterium]|nr:PIN domain nuclease [Balneolaceae bacterium]|tara:strand:- start:15907 stop:16287 length:381 start_codon:yes stop_codon:yes gene_type:complete